MERGRGDRGGVRPIDQENTTKSISRALLVVVLAVLMIAAVGTASADPDGGTIDPQRGKYYVGGA